MNKKLSILFIFVLTFAISVSKVEALVDSNGEQSTKEKIQNTNINPSIVPVKTISASSLYKEQRNNNLREKREFKKQFIENHKDNKKEIRKDRRDNIRGKYKETKSNLREGKREVRKDFKNEKRDIKEKKDRFKNEIKKNRQDLEKRFKNATSSKERDKMKKEARERKIQAKEKKSELRKRFIEKRIARTKAYTERILNRLSAVLDRLETINGRVNSRLDKFDEKGVNTVKARLLMNDSKDQIFTARENVQLIKKSIDEILNSKNPRESYRETRSLIKTTIKNIRGAHGSLVKTIRVMKDSIVNLSSGKTSTEANTINN